MNSKLKEHLEEDLFPRYLSIEEIDNPQIVFEKFYDIARLPQARELLWEMLRAIVTGEYVKMSIGERVNMLYIYEQLQRLIEATYLVHLHYKLSTSSTETRSTN